MKKTVNFIKENQYLIYYCLALFILDFSMRYIYRITKTYSCLDLIPNLFTIGWIFFFIAICFILKKSCKKIFIGVTMFINVILYIVNNIYYSLWNDFFDFLDVKYAKEGSKYFLNTLSKLKIIHILIILLVIILTVLTIITIKNDVKKKNKWILTIVCFVLSIISFFLAYFKMGNAIDNKNWDSFYNKRNVYNTFNQSKKSFMLTGLYQYSYRNFYLTFIKKNSLNRTEMIAEIDNYYAKDNGNSISELNGKLKNKNLILVMMESIDTWVINKEITPTLYEMINNSINFSDYFAISYTNGYTMNSEFIINTGMIPSKLNSNSVYNYNKNNFSYSLSNLFNDAGYISNSFHCKYGSFYNRESLHQGLGYKKHYNILDLDFGSQINDMDTALIENNYKKIILDDKFFSFIITYSAHMPYKKSKPECQKHYDEISKLVNSDNEEYKCILSAARETDDFFKILLSKLEQTNHSKDTVIIAITDHYAYAIGENLLNKYKPAIDTNMKKIVPFFIYGTDIKNEVNNIVVSQEDVLPTIADLFGLNYDPKIYTGVTAFNNPNPIVPFQDESWYDGKIYYNNKVIIGDIKNNGYIDRMNALAKEKIRIGSLIIESDYFKDH